MPPTSWETCAPQRRSPRQWQVGSPASGDAVRRHRRARPAGTMRPNALFANQHSRACSLRARRHGLRVSRRHRRAHRAQRPQPRADVGGERGGHPQHHRRLHGPGRAPPRLHQLCFREWEQAGARARQVVNTSLPLVWPTHLHGRCGPPALPLHCEEAPRWGRTTQCCWNPPASRPPPPPPGGV